MKNSYFKIQDYKILVSRVQKVETGKRDMWGVDAFSGLCHKEDETIRYGSSSTYIKKVKESLRKILDKFEKSKKVSVVTKSSIAQIRPYVDLIESSDGAHEIVEKILIFTNSYKEGV